MRKFRLLWARSMSFRLMVNATAIVGGLGIAVLLVHAIGLDDGPVTGSDVAVAAGLGVAVFAGVCIGEARMRRARGSGSRAGASVPRSR